jgi:hypothetical protein
MNRLFSISGPGASPVAGFLAYILEAGHGLVPFALKRSATMATRMQGGKSGALHRGAE